MMAGMVVGVMMNDYGMMIWPVSLHMLAMAAVYLCLTIPTLCMASSDSIQPADVKSSDVMICTDHCTYSQYLNHPVLTLQNQFNNTVLVLEQIGYCDIVRNALVLNKAPRMP